MPTLPAHELQQQQRVGASEQFDYNHQIQMHDIQRHDPIGPAFMNHEIGVPTALQHSVQLPAHIPIPRAMPLPMPIPIPHPLQHTLEQYQHQQDQHHHHIEHQQQHHYIEQQQFQGR